MRFNWVEIIKGRMSPIWQIISLGLLWLVLISFLHYYLNIKQPNVRIVKMGYMPVVTNLSVPILDYVSKNREDVRFEALKFASFSDMAEAFKHDEIQAAFIIAPLALVMYEKGIPLKIVYIGNRNESTFVVRKNLNIHDIAGLVGKKIAVPLRFSGHNLLLQKLLRRKNINPNLIHIVEMQPPDMAAALINGDLDAYCVGEPFAAQALYSGKAETLFRVEDKWPGFITNLLIMKSPFLKKEKKLSGSFIRALVRAGIWAKHNPKRVVKIAASYWNRSEDIISYAFNTPANRVDYNHYVPKEVEIKYMADLMYQFALVENPINTDNIIDSSYTLSADTTNLSLENIFNPGSTL